MPHAYPTLAQPCAILGQFSPRTPPSAIASPQLPHPCANKHTQGFPEEGLLEHWAGASVQAGLSTSGVVSLFPGACRLTRSGAGLTPPDEDLGGFFVGFKEP